MKITPQHNKRMANLKFASVYPYYVSKVEKKGRTVDDLYQVIERLTGFDEKKLQELITQDVTFAEFFDKATVNPNAKLITGTICGYRIEEIDNELTQKVRYLDKLVDELAKGKTIQKILYS